MDIAECGAWGERENSLTMEDYEAVREQENALVRSQGSAVEGHRPSSPLARDTWTTVRTGPSRVPAELALDPSPPRHDR